MLTSVRREDGRYAIVVLHAMYSPDSATLASLMREVSRVKAGGGAACLALKREGLTNLFCSAGGGLWPTAEMPVGSRGGRFLW
jgi:hypothetical protein